MVPLAPKEEEKIVATAAKKAFKEPGSDKVRLTVEGGKSLQVRLSFKAQVLAFGLLLEKARKGEDVEN
jgi:hypothetical protein